MSNTLKDIDKKIETSLHAHSFERFFKELADHLLPYLNMPVPKSVNYQVLLKKDANEKTKRFICSCLLRVYSNNSKLITESSLKHQIHKFLEEAIPDIYRRLGISAKTETYEIENKLSYYIKDIEQELSNKLEPIKDLASINSYANSYLSAINNQKYKQILSAFLGSKDLKKQSEHLFNLVKRYNDSDDLEKYGVYSEAIKQIDLLIEIAEEVGTKYSLRYISRPFKAIKKLLDIDFRENPYSKPANLTVLGTEKKYRLSKGSKGKIQVLIKNESTGYANNTILNIESTNGIEITAKQHFVGLVKSQSIVEFDYLGLDYTATPSYVTGSVQWTNYNQKEINHDFKLEIPRQNSSIDWENISEIEPYDLEPVTDETEFIGRKKIISELKKIKKKVGSSYIYGQRRVGKTSIVKTLQSSINEENTIIIYFEAGDWNNAKSAQESMDDLGRKICQKIKRNSPKFQSIPIPDFNGSFNRITDFLDSVIEIDQNYRVLIILDEFDRISNDLLYHGNIAQSFMLTIRAISNREQFGFILVGGEKLEYILSQWQEFNKFKPIRVDYFDKEAEWEDFKDLIKVPVVNFLEVSDKAVDFIYSNTSGNPYFTKKVCIELFTLMVSNRDSHVTEEEARRATSMARDSNNIGATDFSHFWKDGIKEKEEKEESISINRRKILMVLGQLLKNGQRPTKALIIDKSVEHGLEELEAKKTLEEFVQRKIVKFQNGIYSFVVKFFEDWLISNGLDKIITTFQEEQMVILRKRYEDEIRIKSDEINKLAQGWPTYKGRQINTDAIRSWLEQFGDLENQRLIFPLIQNLKFYSSIEIREKMEDLFTEVRKEINRSKKERLLDEGQRKRSDILISYLDSSPLKSGAEYAKIFGEANNIYKDNSASPSKLNSKITDLNGVNALVLVDDFTGTGDSIISNLNNLIENSGRLILKRNILVIIGVVAGFQTAKHKIERFASRKNFPVSVKILTPMDDTNKCFDSESPIYKLPLDREKAKELCTKIGSKLEKRHPLGFGGCQALVVFPNTCPNNSLPILWKETKEWTPLFSRG